MIYYDSIFTSIQGESSDTGLPTCFIRLYGCNLSCGYCIGIKGGRHIPKVIMSREPNKKINEVKIGDKLMTLDSEGNTVETEVINTLTRKVPKHLGVKIEGKSELFVTHEHPFMTQRGWVRADELKIGDEIIYVTPNEKISFNKKLENPMKNKKVAMESAKNTDYKEVGRKISKTRIKKFKEGLISPPVMSEDAKKRTSKRMKENNPMFKEETVEKVRQTRKENGLDEIQSKRMLKQWEDLEFRNVQVKRMKEDNPMFNPEVVKKNWKSHRASKSGYEKLFEEMCNDYGLDIEFIGDGKLFINGRNPDFIIPNTNKLVEIYSSTYLYSNGKRDLNWVKATENHYKKEGYKCICLDLDKKNKEDIYKEFISYYHNGLKVEKIKEYNTEIQVYNFTCSPYNTFLVDYMLVHNCDTPQEDKPKKRISVENILDKIFKLGVNNICITGGEPLLQQEIYVLVYELVSLGYNVSIETNGSIEVMNQEIRSYKYVMDIKTPSSLMHHKNKYSNLELLIPKDEVKFVVADREDYEFAKSILDKYPTKAQILFSPMFNKDNRQHIGKDLCNWIIEDKLNARIQIQLHKILGVL